MSQPIIFDVETQHAFDEVDHNSRKLKVSVVGVYDYANQEFKTYREKDLPELFNKFERASLLIGFNIRKFDLEVLSPYYLGNIFQFPMFDILEEVNKILGFRIALDDLARATLGAKKSGHGFLAIDYFRKGEWDKLEKYVLQDVKITRDLFEYLKTNGKLFFQTASGKKEIPIVFTEKMTKSSPVSLSLPF